MQTDLLRALADRLGPGGLLTGSAALSVYSRDASHLSGGRPLAVALPACEEDIAHVIGLCAAAGVPVVARGAGTGLSGGAVPCEDALVLGTARLVALGPVDAVVGAVRAQPGVLNATLTRRAAPHGLHFAPDPSSQVASTIGGNIAENAGGPHCLRLGVTSHHLRALDWCDARGRSWTTGEPVAVSRGIDLRGLLCGSEGTLGIVTGAWLQLTPTPPAVVTLLASFPVLEHATAAVPRLLQAGLLPVAVEIIDQAMVLTVEEAFGFGLPCDVEAVMIAELAGDAAAVGPQAELACRILGDAGAREVRRAADEEQRLALWQCRKRAFGAVGRLSPNYVSMDIVVPLGELPGLVREIQDVRRESGLKIATAFHAGDGNLHPAVHYDERREGETARAHAVADTIIRAALRRRGSVTSASTGWDSRSGMRCPGRSTPSRPRCCTASRRPAIRMACSIRERRCPCPARLRHSRRCHRRRQTAVSPGTTSRSARRWRPPWRRCRPRRSRAACGCPSVWAATAMGRDSNPPSRSGSSRTGCSSARWRWPVRRHATSCSKRGRQRGTDVRSTSVRRCSRTLRATTCRGCSAVPTGGSRACRR
ncbi:MAG: FAD-binding protein [bacterium]|nr:FAD-binding protein [bacterium]